MNRIATSIPLATAALAILAIAFPASAAVTLNWSAGAECGNPSSVTFTPTGAAFQASLCASTTSEKGCGFSAVLQASDITQEQQNNFRVIARVLGTRYPDPNSAVALPLLIANPPTVVDFGGTAARAQPTSIDPGPNQLLATFTFAPQASATNATYAILLSSASEFSTDQGDSTCANSTNSGAPRPTLTLNNGLPPADTPVAPTLNSIDTGPGRATLSFSPPTNTGGSAIVSYTATCIATGQPPRTATGSGSPLTINGLMGGVAYLCSLTATNGTGKTSTASGVLPAIPLNSINIGSILLLLLE